MAATYNASPLGTQCTASLQISLLYVCILPIGSHKTMLLDTSGQWKLPVDIVTGRLASSITHTAISPETFGQPVIRTNFGEILG